MQPQEGPGQPKKQSTTHSHSTTSPKALFFISLPAGLGLDLLYLLPNVNIPDVKLGIVITFGVSNAGADIDNLPKGFIDALQKKYEFNDNRIYRMVVEKEVVKKGEEFIDFELSRIGGNDG